MKGHILEMIEPSHFSVHYAFFQTILSVNNVILVIDIYCNVSTGSFLYSFKICSSRKVEQNNSIEKLLRL